MMNDDDDDDLAHLDFTTEEKARLAVLHRLCNAKMDEIVAVLARELGYGDIASLTEEERRSLEEKAEDAEKQWVEASDAQPGPPEPQTALQSLLNEHHELGEEILDILDEAMLRDRILGEGDDL